MRNRHKPSKNRLFTMVIKECVPCAASLARSADTSRGVGGWCAAANGNRRRLRRTWKIGGFTADSRIFAQLPSIGNERFLV